jgi:hypothetical protein
MRVWPAVLGAVLAAAACTPKSGTDPSPPGTSTGGTAGPGTASGGTTGSGGSPSGTGGAAAGGAPAASAGGTSGGSGVGGAGGGVAGDGGAGPAAETPPSTPPTPGGKALLIVGTIPLVGTDTQFESTLKARGMEVEVVLDKDATPANAEGKRVIIFSYSMKSTTFKAEAYTDVPVPIIVTEHFLLPRIKMVVNGQHGFTPSNLTKLTLTADHELAGGFPKGDVTVYMRNQEMFWGVPTAAAIKVGHIVGAPEKVAFFAYDKGAMMVGATAPAKRVQFFHATHSPDPVDKNLYLNENGLKLLGVTIDWCLK